MGDKRLLQLWPAVFVFRADVWLSQVNIYIRKSEYSRILAENKQKSHILALATGLADASIPRTAVLTLRPLPMCHSTPCICVVLYRSDWLSTLQARCDKLVPC